MSYSKFAAEATDTHQKDSRNGATIGYIQLHHNAGTNGRGVVDMMVSGSKQVSANYVVLSDGTAIGVVPEEQRAWTSGSATYDRQAITFEVENESTSGWTISVAAHETIAQIVADCSRRYGFPVNRWTVYGHNEMLPRWGVSYATACPGAMNIDLIVARANEILSGTDAGPAVDPIREKVRKMSLPLIIQQGEVGRPNYGLNVALYPSGFYKWVNGQQRDAWVESGAILSNETSGHFGYMLGIWVEQQAFFRGEDKRSTREVLAELQALEDASK